MADAGPVTPAATHGRAPEGGQILRDLGAGLTVAVANVPDAMANAMLTGVSPVRGLYALMAGTPTAALTTSSEYLTVVVTGAMAIAVGDALALFGSAQRSSALVTLTILIGAITVALGLFRAGTLMRFVPNAVMRGFLTGVAVNIVLAQVPHVTGATSAAPDVITRTLDILSRPRAMNLGSVVLAALTLAVVLGTERTRLRRFAMAVALVAATVFALAAGAEARRVGDVGTIPGGLPELVLPGFGHVVALLVPAVSVALIGLIQTAGISANTPNRDGSYPDVSRDFVAQGLGSIASGFVGGIPVGGSVSSTALTVQAGARTRLANLVIGPTILGLVVLLSRQVEAIPMAVLAAILIIVGVRAVDIDGIVSVWASGRQSAIVMAVTFVGTLLIPIQYAVLLGIGLTVVRHVYAHGADARVVGLELLDDGRIAETPPPTHLPPRSVTAIEAYGSLAFAGAQALQDALPDPAGARDAIVILRLRGQDSPGSTLVEVLRRYCRRLSREGATLMLAGLGAGLRTQLDRTGVLAEVGRDNVFFATEVITDSTVQAIVEARRRVAEVGRRGA